MLTIYCLVHDLSMDPCSVGASQPTQRSKNLKTYVLQPLVVGASAAFGMSVGKLLLVITD